MKWSGIKERKRRKWSDKRFGKKGVEGIKEKRRQEEKKE